MYVVLFLAFAYILPRALTFTSLEFRGRHANISFMLACLLLLFADFSKQIDSASKPYEAIGVAVGGAITTLVIGYLLTWISKLFLKLHDKLDN